MSSVVVTVCIFWLWVSIGSAKQIRYTLLPSRFVGSLESKGVVGHVDECSRKAIEENKIAFRLKSEGGKLQCYFFTEHERFTKRIGTQELDYILDTDLDDSVCRAYPGRNVLKIISKQCNLGQGCEMLQKIREHCKVVGANIPSCIACPSGFTFTEAFQKCVGIFPIVLNSSITQQKRSSSNASTGKIPL